MAAGVAVVTDSAACLPADVAVARGVVVVPLRLIGGTLAGDDGDPGLGAALDDAASGGARLTSARPSPEAFAVAYRQAAAGGASAVVSVHLSGLLSGTAGSAELAAETSVVPVTVVDSRSAGLGLGLAVLAAATIAAAGGSPGDVADAALRSASQARSFFVLDPADAMAPGGRLAAGRPDPGGTGPRLVARPVLELSAGRICLVERVRTRASAAMRLVELAAGAAAGIAEQPPPPGARAGVAVGVQYTGARDRAVELAGRLTEAIPQAGRARMVKAAGAIRVHAGLGLLGVTVGPCAGGWPQVAPGW